MPIHDTELSQQIQNARTASFGGEVSIDNPSSFIDIKTINFVNGEIDSIVLTDDRLMKRGMVVQVSSRYTGTGVAVVISFIFGETQLPVVISRGGAEGELIACVHPKEITPLQKQSEINKVACLQVVYK